MSSLNRKVKRSLWKRGKGKKLPTVLTDFNRRLLKEAYDNPDAKYYHQLHPTGGYSRVKIWGR